MKDETKNKILYFSIAIFLIGSIGIWLPIIFNLISSQENDVLSIYQNLSTYYIAILVVSMTDLTIEIVKNAKISNKIGKLLFMILIGIISIFYFGLNCYLLWKQKEIVLYLIIFGVLFSYVGWWLSKYNSNDFKPENALGGNAE